jgi:hypothetical protein
MNRTNGDTMPEQSIGQFFRLLHPFFCQRQIVSRPDPNDLLIGLESIAVPRQYQMTHFNSSKAYFCAFISLEFVLL